MIDGTEDSEDTTPYTSLDGPIPHPHHVHPTPVLSPLTSSTLYVPGETTLDPDTLPETHEPSIWSLYPD